MNRIRGTFFLALALPALAFAAGKAATMQNLLAAYNQEVNTKLRYAAFAAKADAEGYPGAAGLFRTVAFSEDIHAANHAKAIIALGGEPKESVLPYKVRRTRENLREALRQEKDESGTLYPEYVNQAVAEGDELSVRSLQGALASEGSHSRLFRWALQHADRWKAKLALLVCRTCGYTSDDQTMKKCPFCSRPRAEFVEK